MPPSASERERASRADAPPFDILVRAPNWLGDLVMSTPGLRSLRAGYPRARITLWVRPALQPLPEGSPFIDRVLPLRSYAAGVGAMWRESRQLRREERFDLGLCIPDSFSSALRLRLAGIGEIVGYAGGGRGFLLHRAPKRPAQGQGRRWVARERHVLGLVAALGCPDLGLGLELHTSEEQERSVRALLSSRGLESLREPLVGLAPGASYGPSKLWPASHFAEVGDRLGRAGVRVVLIGSAAERPLTAAVAGAMRTPAEDLAGVLDLGGLKALVRRLSLLVCNDAGARHLAVAFGVPSIVLMGPPALEKTAANLETGGVLQTDVACRPCYRRHCPIDHRCMRSIGARSVARLALRRLGARPGARDPVRRDSL